MGVRPSWAHVRPPVEPARPTSARARALGMLRSSLVAPAFCRVTFDTVTTKARSAPPTERTQTQVDSSPDVSVAVGSTQPPPMIGAGDVIAGRYRIDTLLASSGMGMVYQATHLELDQAVAIKFLHKKTASDKESIARFRREARVLGKLKSTHIVRVLDIGTGPDGAPFIAMELLDGSDLSSILKREGRQSLQATCDILLQICEALATAQARGIVHRDLKPSNVFISPLPDGTRHATVIDFGVAKLREAEGGGLGADITQTATLIGSPRYMSPEQATMGKVDHRTDVWALGIMLQEMVTGRRVFEAEGMAQTLAAIIYKDPVPVRDHLPDVPIEIEQLLTRTLQKDPEARTPDVLAFAETLQRFASPARGSRVAYIRAMLMGASSVSESGPRPPDSLGDLPSMDTNPSGAETPPKPPEAAIGADPSVGSASAASAVMVSAPGPRPNTSRLPVAMIAGAIVFLGIAGYFAVKRPVQPTKTEIGALPPNPPSAPIASFTAAPKASADVPAPEPSAPEPSATSAPADGKGSAKSARPPGSTVGPPHGVVPATKSSAVSAKPSASPPKPPGGMFDDPR